MDLGIFKLPLNLTSFMLWAACCAWLDFDSVRRDRRFGTPLVRLSLIKLPLASLVPPGIRLRTPQKSHITDLMMRNALLRVS
jgi:hypothetical protein